MTNMVEVKILGISGSPRKGNTEILVKEALKATENIDEIKTDFVSLHAKKIYPCLDCRACERNKSLCIQKDHMQEIFLKIIEADGIIIGTPVYMHTVSAQLKALMDRTTCLYKAAINHDYQVKVNFWNKVGGAIATSWGRSGGVEQAIQTILNYFLCLNMIVVSGSANPEYLRKATCYIGGAAWQSFIDRRDAVKQDELGIMSARGIGERVAKTAKVIKTGLQAMRGTTYQSL